MTFSMIVAASENNVIGVNNSLPWRLSGDLKLLKTITMGHILLMGRKTFESIGRPLPGRVNIVLTSSEKKSEHENLFFCSSVAEAHKLIEVLDQNEVFIFGGSSVYEKFLPLVSKLYLTRVHTTIEGDTFLPEINWSEWKLLESRPFEKDEKNNFSWTFETYQKKN